MTRFRSGSAIDVGRRREKQDDSLLVGDGIFAVADGMGGHVGGDVASSTAIEALRRAYQAPGTADTLERAVNEANRAVTERAEREPSLRSMGTTLAAVAVIEQEDGDAFAIANIGDSRVYLLRDGELTQLTDDHSVPQELYRAGQLSEAEAAVDPRRNQLTRVIGIGDVEPDVQTLIPYQGDRVLICSDGLYTEVGETEIASVLRAVDDPNVAASRLVDMANDHGGSDNIAVVIVDVIDDGGRAEAASATVTSTATARASTLMSAEERNAELRDLARDSSDPAPPGWEREPTEQDLPTRRVTLRVVAFIVLLFVVIGAAFGAVVWYARGTYAVKLQDGRVVILKGRPDSLLWFDPTLERRTSITESALTGGEIELLREGLTEPSREAAEEYVDTLRERIQQREAAATTTTAPGPTTTAPPSTSTTAAA